MKHQSHLGAYAVIRHRDKVALTLKRRGAYSGCWDLPGGKIEFGETPLTALAREINEEVGLDLLNAFLLDNLSNCASYTDADGEPVELHHIGLIYNCEVLAPEKMRYSGDDEDVSEAGWFAPSEIASLKLTPFARRILSLV